jgi:hypothetical protein
MRLAATFLAAALLAACQPAPVPAPAPVEPTPEEMGQDDADVPFVPAAVGPAKEYEAMSKTAMSFTPGVLKITPTPQKSPNLPEGAVFTFGNGYILDTTLSPGGAMMGATPYNFAPVFIVPDGETFTAEDVKLYDVDDEIVPPGAPNGGFCDKTSFIATYTVTRPGAEDVTIAAFNGDQWPPVAETALCGTFTYSNVR